MELGLSTLLDEALVEFGDLRLTGWHALCVGVLDRSWTELESGLAAAATAQPADSPSLKELATAWRRERRLLAGEDLRGWLAARGLSTGDWRGYLERRLAAPRAVDAGPADSVELAVDLLCSGTFDKLGRKLLSWAAARRGLEGGELPPAAALDARAAVLVRAAEATLAARLVGGGDRLTVAAREVTELSAGYDAFVAKHVTARLLTSHLRDRRLAWSRIGWREARFATESAAREAAMMVDLDGLPLERVADLAGVALAHRSAELGEVGGSLESRLVAARPGQLVGPWGEEKAWIVIHVDERVEPTADDERARTRAKQELMDDLLVQHLAGRGSLRWG